MSAPVSLLPSNSTPWELAQSLTSAARRPLPSDVIRSVWNPQSCPTPLLPYLAWGIGLEIWKDDWPEQKKRDVVSRVWQLKRRKTTLKGVRDYVNLVDADVVKAVRPRDKMWWVPATSDAERAALMAKMPEIRIFPDAPSAPRQAAQGFWGNSFWKWAAWRKSDAATRWLDRAVYVDAGVETRVTVTGADAALDASYTIALRASSPAKDFYNRLALHSFRVPSDASDHVVSISPNDGALSFAVPPGLIAASVRPERVAETVAAPVYKAFHWPSFFNASFRTPSDASRHLFDRLRFMDPAQVGRFGRPMSFWGWSHSAVAAFSAELTLKVPFAQPVWAFGAYWRQGFWNAARMDPLWDALEAVTIAQAARDDIWASLQLYQPIEFSGGLRFGEFDFGDSRKVA
jgi:phage tail P2-like protein